MKARSRLADHGLRDRQPWKAAHERDYDWLGGAITKHYHGDETDVKVLMAGIVHAFAGLSVEDYAAAAEEFLRSRHAALDRDYRDCAYLPMIELLRFLEANGFTTFIASGGDRDFMRAALLTNCAPRSAPRLTAPHSRRRGPDRARCAGG